MKFGRQLAELVDPKFRNYCIAYNMLKGFLAETDAKKGQVLQTIHDATSAAVPFLPVAHGEQLPAVRFQEALNGELDKINKFCELEEDSLLNELGNLVRRIRSSADIRSEADRIADEICAFANFVNLNYTAFRKITKKESKVHKTSSSNWFMANVARAPFMSVDFDRLVTVLGHCYQMMRKEAPANIGDSIDVPTSRALSAWVATKDLVAVKVALAKAMPSQIFEEIDKSSSSLASLKELSGSVLMTSIFYDTPWLDSYKAQIGNPNQAGFQVDLCESRMLIRLPSGSTFARLGSDYQSALQNDPEAQTCLQNGFVPLVKCGYKRTIYQSESISVFLDEDTTFYQCSGSAKRLESPSIFEGHTLYVSTNEGLPDWLLDITGLPGVTEVPGFTKRVHGLYAFAESTIGQVPSPSWVAPSKSGAPSIASRRVPSESQQQSRVMTQTQPSRTMPPFAPPNVLPWKDRMKNLGAWIIGDKISKKKGPIVVRDTILKIEPKSFFACERNLLDWIHVCVIVVGLAALVGGVVGLALGLVPCLILLWEARVFRRRNFAMSEKDIIDYSDKIGPQLLFVVLIVLAGEVIRKALV